MGKVVGIDLGTCYSAIAHVNARGKAEIIRNEYGRVVTPSVIYVQDGIPVVGDAAQKKQRAGKKDVAHLFKRYIADEYFLFSPEGRDYSAIDLSAFVLSYLKAQAERYLKEAVTGAVITVPAYFTDPQRKATMKAAEQAGLRVLEIINEPTAAILAHGLQASEEKQCILIYDLGGGTFDLSLVSAAKSELRVIGTDGSDRLGGTDWDRRLLQYIVQQFENSSAIEITDEDRLRLYLAVEQAKHALSIRQRAEIQVQVGASTATYAITRAQFEELTRDLMEEMSMLTERLLSTAGLTWKDITGVLPVGGASRMPMVRSYLERMSGKPPLSGHNPEEVVALGAAMQAARTLDQASTSEISGPAVMIDTVAHSLGMIVESEDRLRYVNSILIQKNTPLPVAQTRSYQIRVRPDGKTQLEIFLTQGDSTDPQHCIYLGRYVFSEFPTLDSSMATLDITYQYDKNGVAGIRAVERTSNTPLKLTVESRPAGVPARFAGRPVDQVRQEHLTVYLAFDLSGSMHGEALEKAKQAAHSFVECSNLGTTSIGLISFSDRTHVDLPASQNGSALLHAIEQLSAGRTGYGNNGEPFEELHALLAPVPGVCYAVVLTDGLWARPQVAIEHAGRCHASGIEVFAVGFGAANREFLSQIATTADRGILVALNQLNEAFSTIAQEIAETPAVEAHL